MGKKVLHIIFVFASLLFTSGCAVDQVCIVDSDCTTVPVGCDGCSCGETINKFFKGIYLEEYKKSCEDYRGPVCDLLCKPYELKCNNNTCEKELIEVEERTCTATEGSKDNYVKGEVTTCLWGNCALHEDFCLTSFDDPTGKEMYEFHCEDSEFKFERITCPNGCKDGACIR